MKIRGGERGMTRVMYVRLCTWTDNSDGMGWDG